MFEIVHTPISLEELAACVGHPESGAIATFTGTTRNTNNGRGVERLEYEAYEDMAVAEFEKIAARVRERWDVRGVAIVHRVGVVPIGETSVAIAVSAPHRAEAIEAAAEQVRAGEPLGAELAKHRCFPPVLVDMVSVGEASGSLAGVEAAGLGSVETLHDVVDLRRVCCVCLTGCRLSRHTHGSQP